MMAMYEIGGQSLGEDRQRGLVDIRESQEEDRAGVIEL